MKKQTSLHIATPCHEDWNQMQPAEKGRFCAQCSLHVTDFTLMTDQQILTYLSSRSGRMCGRFEESQLNRALTETTLPKKRSWYIAFSLPLLLFFQRNAAQPKQHTTGNTLAITEQKTVIGDTILPVSVAPSASAINVQGKITDEEGKPLSFASIVQKNTKHGVASDSAGRFSIQLPSGDSDIVLKVSYVGYLSAERTISRKELLTPLNLSLQLQPARLGEVVVVGSFARKRSRASNHNITAVCRKINAFEKADSALRKITGSVLFTVYPNPVTAGGEMKVRVKKKGYYELQLLDNNSALLINKTIHTTGDEDITSIDVPAQLAAGIYYLRLTSRDNTKSYLQKVIIR